MGLLLFSGASCWFLLLSAVPAFLSAQAGLYHTLHYPCCRSACVRSWFCKPLRAAVRKALTTPRCALTPASFSCDAPLSRWYGAAAEPSYSAGVSRLQAFLHWYISFAFSHWRFRAFTA